MLAMSNDELIGSTEVARILGIDKATLTRWVAAGEVPVALKLPHKNGARLFRRRDIERLAARKAAS